MRAIIPFCIVLFALNPCVTLFAQCTLTLDQGIPDEGEIVFQIEVDNLVNPDLSGGQGICAVLITFRHSYLGDLTIDLISPAGQSVQLVGPPTDIIDPTNLTTWDVRFVQCAFPAAPDAGFTAVWNNDQMWEFLTTYTGSYYPSSGCLEDFNTGSANGIWQLLITDHDMFETGSIESVTLIFCDGTGLECNVCGADAGNFSDPGIEICAGDTRVIQAQYPDTMPDDQLYGYHYLVGDATGAYSFQAQIQTSTMSPGSYTLCGMSYSLEDSLALFTLLAGMTLSEVQTAFSTGTVGHCADLTNTCVDLIISPEIDTTFLNESVCAGTPVIVNGQEYYNSGVYVIPIDVPGACDSVVVLALSVTVIDARVVQMDTITCDEPETMLDGTSSVAGPGAVFTWSTLNGIIIGPTNQQTASIRGAGTYTLTISENGCSDMVSYTVIGDGSIPFISVRGGTLTCRNPTYTFNTVVFPTDVTVQWNGPGGFTSNLLRPGVSVPGTYYLLATDPDGCSASQFVTVGIDTMRITPEIESTVDCFNNRTLVIARPGDLQYQDKFRWTGPNGFTHEFASFWAIEPGEYCVTLTPTNGCADSTCITVQSDYSFPDLSAVASSDTLHCNQTVELTAVSQTPGVTFSWSGPAGAFSSAPMVSVNASGTYIVTAHAPNRCSSQDTIVIVNGSDVFDANVFTDTLNCLRDTAFIGVVTFDPGATYTWSGPGVVDTFDAFTRVISAGIYQVTVSVNGCTRVLNTVVAGDFIEPNYTPFTDTITCGDPIANLSMLISSPYTDIRWLLPDGSTSPDSVLNTTLPGQYILTLTRENGCMRSRTLHVPVDTTAPTLFIESDVLGCDSTMITVISTDSIVSYEWSGPGGFTSQLSNPYVYQGGSYVLRATGLNGCARNEIHSVQTDIAPPALTTFQEELDCLDSLAILSAMSADSGALFTWFYEGSIISESATVAVDTAGEYVIVVTGINACRSTDTLQVVPPVHPGVFATTDTITCDHDATLTAGSDLIGTMFAWEDSEGLTGTGLTFTTTNAGTVTLTGTWTNGCSADTTIEVGIDTIPPLALASTDEVVLCDLQTISLDGSSSAGQGLVFAWSTPDGIILSGDMTSEPTISGEGTYILTVTDGMNGCTDTDTITVMEGESSLGAIFFSAISECEGNGNGSITVDSVPGAATALTFTLEGEVGGPMFEGLSSGDYLLTAIDSFGCETDTLVSITNTSSMSSVSLGEDRLILLGDSTELHAEINLDPSQLVSVAWLQPMRCDACLSNFVSPWETQQFGILIEDIFGCTATDFVTIHVEEKGRYYIPNVFSPNGDEINDVAYLLTHPGVARVERWTIFDRWGDVVLHETDFDGSDGSTAWDGTAQGKEANPGVFVYLLELKLLTGRNEIFTGTITLLK